MIDIKPAQYPCNTEMTRMILSHKKVDEKWNGYYMLGNQSQMSYTRRSSASVQLKDRDLDLFNGNSIRFSGHLRISSRPYPAGRH